MIRGGPDEIGKSLDRFSNGKHCIILNTDLTYRSIETMFKLFIVQLVVKEAILTRVDI